MSRLKTLMDSENKDVCDAVQGSEPMGSPIDRLADALPCGSRCDKCPINIAIVDIIKDVTCLG